MDHADSDSTVLAALTLLALKLRRRAEALDERARYPHSALIGAQDRGAAIATREVANAIESILLVLTSTAPAPILAPVSLSAVPSIELVEPEQDESEEPVPMKAPALRFSDPMDLLRHGRAWWGNPCIYGHQSENGKNLRYMRGGMCVQCQRARGKVKKTPTTEPTNGVHV